MPLGKNIRLPSSDNMPNTYGFSRSITSLSSAASGRTSVPGFNSEIGARSRSRNASN